MVGQPGETRREILTTLQHAWELFERFGARPLVQFATPIRGTALWKTVEERGLWTERPPDDDIGPLFQGRPVFQDEDWTAHELAMAVRVFETKLQSVTPRKIIVNTTYICNNQCIFCATGNRLNKHGPLDEQLAFLDERRRQGYTLVDFDGGEPTTNPNLLRLLRHARDLGFEQVSLTTNGRLMSHARNAEVLVRSGLTNLLVSMHGPNAEVHEAQTQAKGSFAQTLGGIRNALPLCRKHGVSFGVNITLTKGNFRDLPAFGELLTGLGVAQCNVQFLTPFGRASADHQPDPAEAAPYVIELIQKYGEQLQVQVINLPLCYLPGLEAYAMADLHKMERHMFFVTGDDVDLFDFLSSRRRKEAACATCLYSTACSGFYYFPEDWNDEARDKWGD
jgi:MoaA/NifB/PqqE/SkfB family radical SAM enzyme